MKKILLLCLAGALLFINTSVMAQKEVALEDKPVYGVEQMPQFPGGDEALLKFIKDNLKYPSSAAEKGIEGRVTVRFVVDRSGDVTDVTVIRGLDPVCDQEAVRVVKLMPKWTPGMTNGRTVPVYYTLPVVYRIRKDVNKPMPLLIVDGKSRPYSLLKDTLLLKPADIIEIIVLKDSVDLAIYGDSAKYGVIVVTTKAGLVKPNAKVEIKTGEPDKNGVFYGVEKMPQFPGGDQALLGFIRDNLHYPAEAAQFGIQGRVTVRFVVSKIGKVEDIMVTRKLHPALDAEAVRVIKLMPKWTPGMQHGEAVPVYYTLPVVYKLQQ